MKKPERFLDITPEQSVELGLNDGDKITVSGPGQWANNGPRFLLVDEPFTIRVKP
jgi:anaerobic selenocysteine-containing dehydrogenase